MFNLFVAEAKTTIESILADMTPSCILYHVGTNYISRGTPDLAEQFHILLNDTLDKFPNCDILTCEMPPRLDKDDLHYSTVS
jgi:hypothetical protein